MGHKGEASTVSIIQLGFGVFYAPTEPKQAEAAMESAALNPCIYVFVRLKPAEGLKEERQTFVQLRLRFYFWPKKRHAY
jgi:hypothetical protein